MADYYLLVVDNDRGRPRFSFYKASGVTTTGNEPLTLTSADLSLSGADVFGSSISKQYTEPNGTGTFTVNVSEP